MNKFLAAVLAAILMAAAVPARGQDAPPQSDVQAAQDQPPAEDQSTTDAENASDAQQHGVARVSLVEGDVSVQRGDNGEWVAATLNSPISQDDRVSTGEKSRAELQLDFADILRMSDRSTARVVTLSRRELHLQIGQGLVTFNVARGSEAKTQIDTPNASIHPLDGEGEYRIIVNSDAETKIVVRRGYLEVTSPQGTTRVDRGKMITIAGTDNPQYQVSRAPEPDGWDDWNTERNKRIHTADSWHKTNPYYVGSEDLDPYGIWTEIPDYGQVWVPSQPAGWAPYRAGRWVYQPYYGWTWVSYEPWGWAPYHYGRWFAYGNGWAWWPGPVAVYPAYYPIWAPAYVSFFGWGGGGLGVGFGFGFGFGHIGWLPVGPCDYFHPWFGRFGGRVNVVNVTNIHNTNINVRNRGVGPLAGNRGHQYSNVNGALTNSHIRSGFSSMESSQFGKGAVSSHQSGISSATFKQASMMTGKMPVTPSRQSYSATNKAPGASSVRSAPPSSQHFYTPSAKTAGTASSAASGRPSGANSNSRAPVNSAANSRGNSGGNPAASRSTAPPQRPGSTGPVAPRANPQPGNRPATSTAQGAQGAQNPRGGWQHSGPASQSPYGRSPNGSSRSGPYAGPYSRPPLHMNRPIVQPRGGYPAARGGVNRGAPPSGAPHGTPSAPHGGAAPHGGSASSAPHGGGGHSGGGRSR